MNDSEFYDNNLFAIIPMGFCYPGKGKTGDLPPRKECAPLWHNQLFRQIEDIKCFVLIGQYAQRYYLREQFRGNLTETVKAYKKFMPNYFPLPHPSPRNRFWLKKNPWFEKDIIPELRQLVKLSLKVKG